jgi:hypothetical protein
LQKRYQRMVEGHLAPPQRLASGMRPATSDASTWAAAQGAYRFLHNPRVTLRALVEPLVDEARRGATEACDRFVLAMHDWSLIRFRRHHAKLDRQTVGSHAWKEGYELHACLAVSDREGRPLAPVAMSLHADDGAHCTRSCDVRPILSVLDELDSAMTFAESQSFGKPIVHIIDAEADSAAHYRLWSETPGRLFLVRADDRLLEWEGREQTCSAIRETLAARGAFQEARTVSWHDETAEQWVAEATVLLTRPGQQNRADGSRRRIAGPPLALRLILAEVRSPDGQTLATWRLLTNAPAEADAATIALWYYWRWRIESYFKLLKSAGFQLEQWQQETAAAVARRLLVASMACVLVWRLARDGTPEAAETRRVLIRLSGRQMRRSKPFTEPALLAGLWALLQVQYVRSQLSDDELQRHATLALPQPRPGPASEDV